MSLLKDCFCKFTQWTAETVILDKIVIHMIGQRTRFNDIAQKLVSYYKVIENWQNQWACYIKELWYT